MARSLREISSTGVYHVMLRGVEKRLLFLEDADRKRFLQTISDAKSTYNFKLLAWCLMSNHIHLLIEDTDGEISAIMHRIDGTYAKYFNEKYGRVGSLFQGRFKSKPVEDEAYLVVLLAYIHNNPQEAGVCSASSYRWSSYHEYVGKARLADTSDTLEMLGGVQAFADLVSAGADLSCFDEDGLFDPTVRVNPKVTLALAGLPEIFEDRALTREERGRAMEILKSCGYSNKEIGECLGISASTVSRASRKKQCP